MSAPRWSRRDFLGASGLAATASALGALSCGESRSGPNLILITADDLGWLDLSSYGSPNVRTPNLDRLAAGGVSFTRAFDVTSTCSSSRTTYATGQYPHTHGVTGLVHRMPELSLPDTSLTLAKQLQKAGLTTAIEGKWHLAFPATPEAYGYDTVMTSLLTQRIADSTRTVDFLRRTAGQRFYLEINYMNPHRDILGNFQPHEDHPIEPATITIPAYVQLPDVPGAREELAAYYSQVERMDVMIGELLAALEELNLLDDTLIAFISDNGIPFPGNKLHLHDRGTGTPLFFHWPLVLPAGVERDDLVSSVDLMPTLLEGMGAAIPDTVQGESLWPLLVDPTGAAPRAALFSEMTTHTSTPFPMRSARTGRYRYIRNYDDRAVPIEGGDQDWVMEVLAMDLPGYRWDAPRVPEELYDLTADPQEQSNLVEDPTHAAALDELRALLDAHLAATEDPYLGRAFEMVAG